MVNDDKAFLALRPDGVWAYGSPWMGKHGIGTNISVPLKGICFLQRGTENRIQKAMPEKWLPELKDHLRPSCRLYHTYGKPDMETAGTYLEQHPSQVTLRLWLAGEWNLPKLIIREGRMELEP